MNITKIAWLCILLLFIILNVQATTKTVHTKNLDLKLSADLVGTTKDKIPLKIELTNKTNETLSINIPLYSHQLTVYLLSRQGKKQRLEDLLKQVKGRSYPLKNIVLLPQQTISYKWEFDLTPYKDDVKDMSVLQFEAKFDIFRHVGNNTDVSALTSNILDYQLPSSKTN